MSLYSQLFGKSDPIDASVTDFAEHGRAGGLSTGQPFKYVAGIELKEIIDDSNSGYIYIGESQLGASTSETIWRITKWITTTPYESLLPNGNDDFSFEWDERANYSYE